MVTSRTPGNKNVERLQLTPKCRIMLLSMPRWSSSSAGDRPRDLARSNTRGASTLMSPSKVMTGPTPSGRSPIQVTGSSGYFTFKREFFSRASLWRREVEVRLNTESDNPSYSRDFRGFLQPLCFHFVLLEVFLIPPQLFLNLPVRVIKTAVDRDNGSSAIHLEFHFFFDLFADVLSETCFESFTVPGPKATPDLFDLISKGVKCSFDVFSV